MNNDREAVLTPHTGVDGQDEAFAARGRLLLEQTIRCPVPDDDVPRRRMFHAIARLGLGTETDTALKHIAETNDDPGNAAMFFRHANIDAMLRFGHLYDGTLSGKVKESMTAADHYSLQGGTENHRIMNAVAGFLTGQVWPDWERAADVRSRCAEYLGRYFTRITHYGQGEFDSTTYSVFYINTLATLYDFSLDPQLRRKAGMTIDWLLANTAGDWLNGIFTGAHSRDYHPTETITNAAAGTTGAWLYFGGREPDFPSGECHYAVINALSAYRAPAGIVRLAQDRDAPFEHRETHDVIGTGETTNDNHRTNDVAGADVRIKGYGYVSRAGVYKYNYVAKGFTLGSMADGKQGDVVMTGQTRRWSLDWDSAQPSSVLFFNHPFPDFGRAEERYVEKWIGSSPYEQVVQAKGALVSLVNIPSGETYQYGPRDPFPSDRDPYIDGFISGTAILQLAEDASGWLFAHGGSVLIAVRPLRPYRWLEDGSGHRRLRSEGLKNGVVVEAADPAGFAEREDAGLDEQAAIRAVLERFRGQVLLRTRLDDSAIAEAAPTVAYTSLSGDVLRITYDGERTVNGEPVRFERWPLIGNPFLHSAVGSGLMELKDGAHTTIWDFKEWTVTKR
ncbi:hypothetical protein FE784_10545 [Paenibacillus hemerocallicola]|uniref:Alginate lyase domain-containing protein n=1 Tax=Paenibacillus hemerocallicola TaxID=1172614 RepID=A0A5C4TD21_9BACL|nr:hypothetical protein [Paenibacillus hemerocallicola]TNJ66407.1 hypothetical protein FE784_10545 [Paenibacillus hemerocallicola]